MNGKHILGLFLIVIGAALGYFGTFVSGEVEAGGKKLQAAQYGVDAAGGSAETHEHGKYVTGGLKPVQSKLDEGKMLVQKYGLFSSWMGITGVILFMVGVIIFIFGFFFNSKR